MASLFNEFYYIIYCSYPFSDSTGIVLLPKTRETNADIAVYENASRLEWKKKVGTLYILFIQTVTQPTSQHFTLSHIPLKLAGKIVATWAVGK